MKHPIDKRFKELKHFEEQPPIDAWDAIERELDNKSKRRTPILWLWRRTAVAASLLLFMSVGTYFWVKNANNNPTPEISDIQADEEINDSSKQNPLDSHSSTEQNINNDSSLEQITKTQNTNNSTYDVETSTLNSKNQKNFNQNQKSNISSENNNWSSVVVNNDKNNYNKQTNSNSDNNQNWVPSVIKNNDESLNENQTDEQDLIASQSSEIQTPFFDPLQNITKPNDELKDNPSELEDALLANTNPNKEKDNNEKKKEEIKRKRFDVLAYAAPIYYSSLNGSASMPELDGYNTSDQISYSYGVKAAYAVSKKIKVRTGIAMVNLMQVAESVPLINSAIAARTSSFSTANEVNPNTIVSPPAEQSINYASGLRVSSQASVAVNDINATSVGSFNADVQQEIQYIEIPVEAEYQIKQGKTIGISATGGMSSYILTDNLVSAESENGNQLLGEANNLNNVSFSGNAGIKLDVNVTKNATFSVEPQFKYMFNAVNNNSDFQPYTIGVNAGVLIRL